MRPLADTSETIFGDTESAFETPKSAVAAIEPAFDTFKSAFGTSNPVFWNIHAHLSQAEPTAHAIYSCTYMDRFAEGCLRSVSIHPWQLTEENCEAQWQWLCTSLHGAGVVAIGEVGLDRCAEAPFDLQLSLFRRVVELSEEGALPLILHVVRASNEILRLRKELHARQPWIVHGFRGKRPLAEEYVRHGLYLSFGEHFQADALRAVPQERLLLETDESVLSIETVYGRVARELQLSPASLQSRIEQNVQELFFEDNSCIFK